MAVEVLIEYTVADGMEDEGGRRKGSLPRGG